MLHLLTFYRTTQDHTSLYDKCIRAHIKILRIGYMSVKCLFYWSNLAVVKLQLFKHTPKFNCSNIVTNYLSYVVMVRECWPVTCVLLCLTLVLICWSHIGHNWFYCSKINIVLFNSNTKYLIDSGISFIKALRPGGPLRGVWAPIVNFKGSTGRSW